MRSESKPADGAGWGRAVARSSTWLPALRQDVCGAPVAPRPPSGDPCGAAPVRPAHARGVRRSTSPTCKPKARSRTMILTVLGSGTVVPHPEFTCAGYHLDLDDLSLLMDCGP